MKNRTNANIFEQVWAECTDKNQTVRGSHKTRISTKGLCGSHKDSGQKVHQSLHHKFVPSYGNDKWAKKTGKYQNAALSKHRWR